MARLSFLALVAGLAASSASAQPYVPARADEVLEELPASLGSSAARELRAEARALASQPHDAVRATRFARRCLEQSTTDPDPRWHGYAEAALEPWWALEAPPADVLLLRASLRQHRHDFAGALADLERLVAQRPDDAQAWLTRALIEQVTGELASAQRSCLALLRLADPLTSTTCLAGVASLAGRAEPSFALLERALASGAQAQPAVRLWSTTTAAELAERLGRDARAGALYRAALAHGPDDAYLLAAFADFLLDRGRPAEVIAWLDGRTRSDALLLRLALAERALGSPAFEARARELRARFAASRARGEGFHAGEEARFALHVQGDPAAALALARESFALQREPRDARILLEAALAARDPSAAQPALDWLARNGLEDVRLARLAKRVEAAR